MEDIFNDDDFNTFLYGGIKDLDEPLGKLVYRLYQDPGIQTGWSCSGHIGETLTDRGSVQEGYFAYMPGILKYSSKGDHDLNRRLIEISNSHNFAEIARLQDGSGWFTLEMDDIAIENPEFKAAPFCFYTPAQTQVLEEKAKERYQEFLSIWDNLTKEFC